MNLLYISPDFPVNFQQFVKALSKKGVNVFGVGEADFFSMPTDVRDALKYYEKCNLHDFGEVKQLSEKMLREFGNTEGYQIVESHNEFWIPLEVELNEYFNCDGFRKSTVDSVTRKSSMKRIFESALIPYASGEMLTSLEQAKKFTNQHGYPVILKPDRGVGGTGVYKINSTQELTDAYSKIKVPYVIENFIKGKIKTYDGLTDSTGKVVFESSLQLSAAILDYINGEDIVFFTDRNIEEDLRSMGKKIIDKVGLKRKFFHIEFFQTDEGFIPIEINARPPGGIILDMMNYSSDIDLYSLYSDIAVEGSAEISQHKKYYCAYVSPRSKFIDPEIFSKEYPEEFISFEENPPLYHEAMGRYRFLIRTPEQSTMMSLIEKILIL
ncbi:MAG: ATP-grasp domain-containing protein [Deltaproteobacteria bacterium]|nr:ATP-grasp domain-containing protein [Deltaproteobacteria bacterium]